MARTPNLMELAERAIAADYDPSVLDAIEEYRPPTAPNIVTWMTDPNYMLKINLFPRQVYLLATFTEDYCPMRFCSDVRWFSNQIEETTLDDIYERVTFLEHGICPRCGANRAELYKEGLFNNYTDFVGCAGQRSGKTLITAGVLATYHLHRVLALPMPWRYYGLAPNQILHFTFVATTKGQAKMTLWDEFIGAYNASPWFAEYNAYLTCEGKRLGKELVKPRETFVAYVNKAIVVTYADSHKQKLRGLTRIFGAEDEIGWFDSNDGKNKIIANPDETYKAIENSLMTVRSKVMTKMRKGEFNIPTAIHATVSSPSRKTDKIMRLVRQAHKARGIYAFHHSTFEINPTENIDAYADMRVKEPLQFARDFEANPLYSSTPYVEDYGMLEKITDMQPVCSATVEYYTDKKGEFTYIYQKFDKKLSDIKAPLCLSVDAGEKFNHFAVVLAYLTPEGGLRVIQAFDIAPEIIDGVSIAVNMPKVLKHLIKKLLDNFCVRDVVYDRWESAFQIQEIRDYCTPYADKGMSAVRNSPKYADGMEFRASLPTARLPLMERPFSEMDSDPKTAIVNAPGTHLVYQLVSVREVGRSLPKKGVESDDDIFRAVLNAFAWMTDAENIKFYTDHSYYSLSSPSRGKAKGLTAFGAGMSGPKVTSIGSSGSVGAGFSDKVTGAAATGSKAGVGHGFSS